MPIYEYLCNDCGTRFEELVRGDEKPACSGCGGGRLTKLLSVPAAHTGRGRSELPVCGGPCNPAACDVDKCPTPWCQE